jgi:hypothetical protein
VSQDAPSSNTPAEPAATEAGTDNAGVMGTYDELPRWLKLATGLVIIVVLAVLIALWHDFYFHWFEVHTGTINETGTYYAFWSGFGSDIGEATLVVGVAAVWRHHNCHVKGCLHLGRPVPGTPYIACPKHHPAHAGNKRAVSLETIVKAHEAAKKQNRLP